VFSKIRDMKYTTMMFVVIFFISILTISVLSLTSVRSGSNGLFQLGKEALKTVHESMMNSLHAFDLQVKSKLKSDITILSHELNQYGLPYLDNQSLTKVGDFTIPKMMLGDDWIGANTSLVDGITKDTGATATVFQLIDNKLLRISTSVKKKNGERATGTFIASDSPVYQAIMRGEIYLGRAFVVDDWSAGSFSLLYRLSSSPQS
jgi:methyl-accepting chemotaxis protein